MKKFYTLLAAVGVTASMAAQQLPNAGFEESWVESVPWTSKGNTNVVEVNKGTWFKPNKVKGYTPTDWTISHVIGIGGLGATIVGEKVEGNGSESAVRIVNSSNSFLPTQIVPGYMALGTTWSTSVMGQKNDGGTFEGIKFSFRPDAIAFDYKRENAGSEKSSVVAYTWKGTFTQADVPGEIVTSGDPTPATMTDRDRQVLGYDMSNCLGGEKTKSEDAALISKIIYNITEDKTDWTAIEIPFEFVNEDAPEKINVIFSAGDYFATTPTKDFALTVDNVKLVYYSRLSGLKFKDADIADFDPDKFDYALDEVMPTDEKALAATPMGNSGVAEAAIELDHQNSLAKITVTNAHGNDADDQNSHVYTVKFLPAGSSINDVIDMTSADVRYVDLYGNAVAADALINGQTYIKLVNGKATKVIANN